MQESRLLNLCISLCDPIWGTPQGLEGRAAGVDNRVKSPHGQVRLWRRPFPRQAGERGGALEGVLTSRGDQAAPVIRWREDRQMWGHCMEGRLLGLVRESPGDGTVDTASTVTGEAQCR